MSTTIIDFDACLARLRTNNPNGDYFKTLETALDMNPIEDDSEMPAVFIYPGWVDADPMSSGAVRQRVNQTLVLDLICNVDDVRTAVGHLRSIMLGWEMDENHAPFTLADRGYMQNQACGPVDLKGGVIHWQERYLNKTHTKLIHN